MKAEKVSNILFNQKIKQLKGSSIYLFPYINSVTQGIQNGNMYFFENNNYIAYFVIHKAGFAYYYSNGDQHKAFSDFLDFAKETPEIPNYFHLYDFPYDPKKYVALKGLNHRNRERRMHVYKKKQNPSTNALRKDLGKYKIISIENASENDLEYAGLSIYKTRWESLSELKKKGCGVCIKDEYGYPVAICYSAAVDKRTSEIDVLVSEKNRNKGLGIAITQAYIDISLKMNLLPVWDCFTDNIPSLKVAEKVGFSEGKTYRFISIFDPNK